jgi:hypothetical protein
MHASPLLLAALAALSTSALAAPSASTAPAAADFSFAQWVEDMIADPAGAHLSPAEAVEAKNAAVAASLSPLRKRINCDKAWARANVRFATFLFYQSCPTPSPVHGLASPLPLSVISIQPKKKKKNTVLITRHDRPTTHPPAWRTWRAKAPREPHAPWATTSSTCRCAASGTPRWLAASRLWGGRA